MRKNVFFSRPNIRLSLAGWLIFLCLGITSSSVHGQKISVEDKENIQAIVKRRMKSDHLAGVAVCVVEKGRPIYCEAFGYADVKSKRKLTTDTPFQLASLSKQFAATAVMLLVGDGKLTLDDPIGKHLGDIPEEWKPITVRQLLGHTSGIKDYAKFPNIRSIYQEDPSREEMLVRIYGYPLEFQPGEKFSYSNSGYTIVGCLIETVSGKDYGTFLKERIFDPLEMKTAQLEPTKNSDPERAIGHDFQRGKFSPASYNSPVWAFAAGGIVGSINDLAKWDAAIDGNKLLTTQQQKQLWTRQKAGGKKTEYGMGWMLRPGPQGKQFAFHFGNKPGFSASMVRLVEDRLAIAVLSNRTEGSSQQLLDEIGKMLLASRAR